MDDMFCPPSTAITSAFEAWREMHLLSSQLHLSDTQGDVASRETGRLFGELANLPITTASDFVVKAYVDLLSRCGASLQSSNDFDIENAEFEGNGLCDDAYMHSVYRDLDSCDLGRCLLGLGSAAFDPARWIDAMDAAEGDALVIIAASGEQRLSIVSTAEDPIQERQQLRLRRLATGRTKEIGSYILANRPDKVAHLRADAA
jgi:hypothetical protein